MKILSLKILIFVVLAVQLIANEETADGDLNKSFAIFPEVSVPLPQETEEYACYLNNMKGALFVIRYCQHLLYTQGKRSNPHSQLDDIGQVKRILKLALEIRQNENRFPDYYQLITAQTSHYFAYQVIAKELHQRLSQQKRENFEFLRYPSSHLVASLDDFFLRYPHMLNQDFEDILTETDVNPEIGRQILSLNLSLETHHPFDSSLWIFLEGKGALRLDPLVDVEIPSGEDCFKWHLLELFETAGIDKEFIMPYIDELIAKAPVSQEGIINQIFIPKKRIKEFVYVSFPAGFLNVELTHDIEGTIAAFHADQLQEDPNNDNLQFRLLASKLFDDDILIFRYSLIPEEEQRSYQELVSDLLDNILPKLP